MRIGKGLGGLHGQFRKRPKARRPWKEPDSDAPSPAGESSDAPSPAPLSEARSRASYHSFLSAGSRTDQRRSRLAAGRCACSSLLEDELGERASLDILHRVEVAPVLASDREDWHDVRVVELGRCMRLDAEAAAV